MPSLFYFKQKVITMDELDLLKQRADTLGIKYSPNIGVDTLKAKIEEKLNGSDKTTEPEAELTATQAAAKLRHDLKMSEMALVRLRIANLNPDKKDLQGEIFTVSNKYVGTVRKYIPYGERTDNGWHVPNILYKQLKARKFLQTRVIQHKDGNTEVQQKWVPEFALEVLPQLSQEELNELAATQRAGV